jgi:hypothetical protein
MPSPKVLFIGANGRDTTRLRLGAEVRDIQHELQAAGASEAFRITAELAVRPTDLQRLLLLHEPDVIHFSGHGSETYALAKTGEWCDPLAETGDWPATSGEGTSREFMPSKNAAGGVDEVSSGGLLLEDERGAAVAVRPEVLTELLAIVTRDKPLRCVVLNACFTASQAQAIARHVDCVIGTTRDIDDYAAIAFSVAFYRAIAHGKSVGTAFDLGRVEIGLRCRFGMDVPRLFHSPDVAPERVFLGDGSLPEPMGCREVETEKPTMKSSEPRQIRKRRTSAVSGKRSAPPTRPLKSVALLDRRLVMEMLVWWSALEEGIISRRVDARSQRSILYALSLYDQVLVEDPFSSALGPFFQNHELLEESILYVACRKIDEESAEFSAAVDVACRAWMKDPSFQLAAATYERSVPVRASYSSWFRAEDDLPSGVDYMKHTLLVARHFNAAVVPHPDRFRLYRHWFENGARLPGAEQGQTRTVLDLPAPAKAAEVVSARRAQLITQVPCGPARDTPPVCLIQYGPTVFPVSAAYAKQPESAALKAHPVFTFEFCTAGSLE